MKIASAILVTTLTILSLSVAHTEEPRPSTPHRPLSPSPPAPTLDQARRQAEILHSSMHATLQIVHHYYYREDEGLLLPAATLQEVFAAIEQEQQIKLRWLAVEGQVMNTDHAAKDDFEHAAVKALQAGQPFYERTENGVLRRAAPITLTNQCLKCHVPDRKSTEDRTAGLIISMPVQ